MGESGSMLQRFAKWQVSEGECVALVSLNHRTEQFKNIARSVEIKDAI